MLLTFLEVKYTESSLNFHFACLLIVVRRPTSSSSNLAILVVAVPNAGNSHYLKYLIYRPNTGEVFDTENYNKLMNEYRKVKPQVAKKLSDKQYELSLNLCFHAFRSKDHTCKTIRNGGECEEGRRRRNYHVVSLSLLSVWPQIEQALSSCSVKRNRKIQMIRIKNDQGRIIGIKMPNEVAGNLFHDLKNLDLTGVIDGTAGKTTEKKLNPIMILLKKTWKRGLTRNQIMNLSIDLLHP